MMKFENPPPTCPHFSQLIPHFIVNKLRDAYQLPGAFAAAQNFFFL